MGLRSIIFYKIFSSIPPHSLTLLFHNVVIKVKLESTNEMCINASPRTCDMTEGLTVTLPLPSKEFPSHLTFRMTLCLDYLS